MNNLQKQYFELLASQQFQEEELDYSVLDRHIAALNSSNIFSGSALSIFDLYRREHVYESEYHKKLFMDPQGEYAGVQIHPEDYMQVTKNGVAGMRHVFMHKKQNRYVKSNKLIREYRVLIHGVYKRITEEMQILEMDNRGNVWLVLSIVNISPKSVAAIQSRLATDQFPDGRCLFSAGRLFRQGFDSFATRGRNPEVDREGLSEQRDRR